MCDEGVESLSVSLDERKFDMDRRLCSSNLARLRRAFSLAFLRRAWSFEAWSEEGGSGGCGGGDCAAYK